MKKGQLDKAIAEFREAHQAPAFIYRGKGLYAASEKEYKIVLSLVCGI